MDWWIGPRLDWRLVGIVAVDWLCLGWIGLALRSVPYSPGSISLLRDVRTGWYSIGSGLVINWQIGEGLVFDC